MAQIVLSNTIANQFRDVAAGTVERPADEPRAARLLDEVTGKLRPEQAVRVLNAILPPASAQRDPLRRDLRSSLVRLSEQGDGGAADNAIRLLDRTYVEDA